MKRIDKATAEKLFTHGRDVYLCRATLGPCNIREPAQRYNIAEVDLDFNRLVNDFTYYTGRSPYYVVED